MSTIKGAIITEKAMQINETENKYTFVVDRLASKGQVKADVERIYGVKVANVNIVKTGPKSKRSWVKARKTYLRTGNKKAIVELADGQSIKIYDTGK